MTPLTSYIFEPLSWNEVKSVLDREKPDSVIIQLGGQTPLKLAKEIHNAGFNIAGSSLDVIDSTEDRDLFQKLCTSQDIKPVSYTHLTLPTIYSV